MSRPQDTSSISVFFPAFNDEGTIAGIVEEAIAILPQLTNDYEVLVINDGSIDATGAILDKLAERFACLQIIHHPSNKGYGATLRTGFTHASKDLIFYTDGDGQYDVRELKELLSHMSDTVDVVNGYKIEREDSYDRKVLGAIYNICAHYLFKLPIRDVDCDFRLIRRLAIQQIQLNSSSGVICVELVHKLYTSGCVFAEMPVHHYPRTRGRSQFFTRRRVLRTIVDFFALWIKLVVLQYFSNPTEAEPIKHAEHARPVEKSSL